MAWQIPQSVTQAGPVVSLTAGNGVFVASGVTIAATSGIETITGFGNGLAALIYGTVASAGKAIHLGDDPTLYSGQVLTVKASGQVHGFGGLTIVIGATSSQITNEGLIAAHAGTAIVLDGESGVTTSTIVNSGTIEAADKAIVRNETSTETISLLNSGLISGGTAAYGTLAGNPIAKDLITNTGQIVGDILLFGGDDIYDGALGRLNGTVFGGDGADSITGGIDDDTFFGDAGNDILTGGLGKDSLTGGADRDIFDFNSAKESVKGADRDVIEDFVSGDNITGDDIDLSTIDAKTGGGNQAFHWISTQKFHHVKGELRYTDLGASSLVQGDINGDGKVDFEILVKVGALGAGDFIL